MRPERRQLILGTAIVVVLGLAAWTLWPSTPAPLASPVAAQTRAGGGRASREAAGGSVDAVKLDALKGGRDEPGQAGRNPFRFRPKVAPPPQQSPKPVMTDPIRSVPTGPPGPPPLPPIALKLIGVLERASGAKWDCLDLRPSFPPRKMRFSARLLMGKLLLGTPAPPGCSATKPMR